MKLDRKNIILFGGVALMSLLTYQLGFKKTIDTYKNFKALEQQKQSSYNAITELASLTKRNLVLSKKLESYQVADLTVQNSLLAFLNQASEELDLKINSFNPTHEFAEEHQNLNSYTFEISGGYVNLLKCLNQIENKSIFGEIKSVNFEAKTLSKQRNKELKVFVVLQLSR